MTVRLDCARTGAYRRPCASNVCPLASPPVHSNSVVAAALYIHPRAELTGQPWLLFYWVLCCRRVSNSLGSCSESLSVVLESRRCRNQGWLWMRKGAVLWCCSAWFCWQSPELGRECWCGATAAGPADRELELEFELEASSTSQASCSHLWPFLMELASFAPQAHWSPEKQRDLLRGSAVLGPALGSGDEVLVQMEGSVLPSCAAGILVPHEKQHLWSEAVNFTLERKKKKKVLSVISVFFSIFYYFIYIFFFSTQWIDIIIFH